MTVSLFVFFRNIIAEGCRLIPPSLCY